MSSNLEKFKRSVIGSNNSIADYTPVIAASGDFVRVTNLAAIIKSWNNILLTPITTASHDPEYGSDLFKYVFEPVDEFTQKAIAEEVRYRLLTYDNRATITNITVSFLKNGKGFNIALQATYNDESGELSLTIDETSQLGFMGN